VPGTGEAADLGSDPAAPEPAAPEPAAPEPATGELDSGTGELDAAADDPDPAADGPDLATAGLDGAAGEPGPDTGAGEPATSGHDPLAYAHDGSYLFEQDSPLDDTQDSSLDEPGDPLYQQHSPFEYGQDEGNAAEYATDSGYYQSVSPQFEESPVPPYPAELPTMPAATAPAAAAAAARSGFASAAYRALPKPRLKAQKAPARRANLVIARIELRSVMKFSFWISLIAFVVLFVAVALIYYTLSGLGVFAALQRTLSGVTSSTGSSGVNLATWTSPSRVFGYTMLIGAANIVIITILSTIGAMIYNLIARSGAGIEITLKESD
jgi:hypothetical protein